MIGIALIATLVSIPFVKSLDQYFCENDFFDYIHRLDSIDINFYRNLNESHSRHWILVYNQTNKAFYSKLNNSYGIKPLLKINI